MANDVSRRRRRLKILAVAAGLPVLIAIAVVLGVGRGGQEVISADGGIVRLERYEFRSDTVRYHQAKRPMAQALWHKLPIKAKKRFSRFMPGVTVFVGPDFPNEPVLSAAFSARDASGKETDAGTRVVVSDDRGQAFDRVYNYAAGGGVFSLEAFPRRGRELVVRLMDGERPMADFKIPNPCRGPHP